MRLFRVSDDQNELSSSLFVAFREDEEAVIRDQKLETEKKPRTHIVVRCRGHGCIWRVTCASEIIQQEACPTVVSHRLLIPCAAISLKSEVVPLSQGHDESLFRLIQAEKNESKRNGEKE